MFNGLFGRLGCKLGLNHKYEEKAVKRFGKIIHFRICNLCNRREFWSIKLDKWILGS